MPHFTANLSFLFTERPFLERFAAARAAGFDTVEFMFPYEYELGELKSRLEGLRLVLFNLPAGNWSAGDRGLAANADRKEEFRRGVDKAIETATALGVQRLNCLVGMGRGGETPQMLQGTLMENLAYAADLLQKEGIMLMVEPVNHFDMPGFSLNTCRQVLDLIQTIGHPNLYLQFDVYHARREGEDVLSILRAELDKIGHIQIADCPGRHQPGTGETDFGTLLPEIDRLGYQGFVSLEYIPTPDTESSLAWLSSYGYRLR